MAKAINELLNDFVDSKNRHDVRNIIQFYAENIIGKLAGIWLKNSKKEMQDITEWETVMKPIYKISHITILKDSARCRLVESNEWLRLMGIESIAYEPFLITIENDRITTINAEFAIDSYKKYQDAWATMADWVNERHPDQYATLFKNDSFKYDGKTARQWLDLVKEYQTTVK